MNNILEYYDSVIEDFNELEDVSIRVGKDKCKIIGFDKELKELEKGLCRLKKPNVLLVGEPGVGKTALVEKFAKLLTVGNVARNLRGKKVYELYLNNTIAGTRYRGDFEEKIVNILNVIEKSENVILFIDEIHNIMGLGAGKDNGGMPMSDTLKPYLARGIITVIGATTKEEYEKYIKPDKALNRRFYKVNIKEPSKEDTLKMLMENKQIISILKKSRKREGYFPDKAFDELETYCYDKKLRELEGI